MDFLGLLGFVGNAIDAQINAVVLWTTAQFGVLYGDIANVEGFASDLATWTKGVLSTLWTWLQSLWQWLHDLLLVKLRDLLDKIHAKLKDIFGPLLAHIRQIIDAYRKLWLQYVKPIYDFLQRVRRVLVLFRLLGFRWAKRLDARIVALETAISNSFLYTLRNLNLLSDWINYIIDPFGLFQPSVWLGSIAQSIGAIIGIAYDRMNNPAFVGPQKAFTPPENYLTASASEQRIRERMQIGPLPEDALITQDLHAAAVALGYNR
jgi:hypothetical protein